MYTGLYVFFIFTLLKIKIIVEYSTINFLILRGAIGGNFPVWILEVRGVHDPNPNVEIEVNSRNMESNLSAV